MEDDKYREAQEVIRKKWLVSAKKKEESLERILSIDYPSGWLSSRRNIWDKAGTMNASQYLDFLQKYAFYAIDGVFDNKEVQETAMDMIEMFLRLARKEHKKSEIPILRKKVIDTLIKWEEYAPDDVKPIILHLLVHMVDDIERFGSVYNFWLFGPERMLGTYPLFLFLKHFLGWLGRCIKRQSTQKSTWRQTF